jgi:DNA topoisomerase-1
VPTENGIALCDFLTAHFADVLAYDYTARLESNLDRIAAGDTTRVEVLQSFWAGFHPQLGKATEYALAQVKARHTPKPLMLRPAEE